VAQHTPPDVESAKIVSCEFGSVSAVALPTPKDFAVWFAVAVIQVHAKEAIANARVSQFDLVAPLHRVTSMRSVVDAEQFNESVNPDGILDSLGGQQWSGAIPPKPIWLRLKVSLGQDPASTGMPKECVIHIGPFKLRHSVDAEWPTT
jgi:hypothetical protein